MYSLWRGNALLGQIDPQLPGETADAVFGILDPSADFLPGQAMSQHTMLDWPGTPVFQHINDRPAADTGGDHRQFASDGPRTLNEAIRDSVPIDRQLSLRDASNTNVATQAIAVMAMPRAGRRIQHMCDDARVTFSGWCVVAALATPARDAL